MSSLNELFKQLEVHSAAEQHEEVFETAYEILKSSPHDSRALRFTIGSLINLDRYLKAFKVLQQYKQAATGDELLLEKLYVYYKLNLNKELAQEFSQLDAHKLNENRGLLHLKAQYLYRLGEYEASLDIYRQLIESTESTDAESLDLSVNERAVLADGYQVGVFNRFNSKTPVSPSTGDSYDLTFNESVIQLAQGNYSKALELLESAESLCKEANPDPEDQVEETTPILLQKAYIYSIIGESVHASRILTQLSALPISDELNKLILNNNLIVDKFTQDSNIALIFKELNLPNSLSQLGSRLSLTQKSKLWKNFDKLSVFVGKKINNTTISAISPDSDYTSRALKSLYAHDISLDGQDTDHTRARKAYKAAIKTKELPISLMAAQLNINAGNFQAVSLILENLDNDLQVLPGVASVLLSVYDEMKSSKKRAELFEKVFAKYSQYKEFTNPDVYEFLKIFALKFLSVEPVKSKELLNNLNAFQKDELISIVLGEGDNSKLESVESLTSGLDLDQVIDEGVSQISKESAVKPISHKITKRRVKKNKKYEGDVTKLDPERWLPMKDRSYYKPKKGKKKAGNRDTQGGVADNSTEENMVSRVRSGTPVSSAGSSKKNKKKSKK